MTAENVCPSCGTSLDNYTGDTCPSCGTALPNRTNSGSAPTIISKKSSFTSSAEAMDEIKKLVKEGDTAAAQEVAGKEFDLNQSAAEATVEQVHFDMKQSGWETPPAQTEPAFTSPKPEVIDAPGYDTPKKPSNSRNWTIGGIAAAVFLCCCCCLPILVWIVRTRMGR
jgi:uncharacterized Zn finger protein (UPF0148 family)